MEDDQVEMKVCKSLLKLTRYICSPSDKVLTFLGSPRPGSYHSPDGGQLYILEYVLKGCLVRLTS